MPNADDCVVTEAKLVEYLMNLDHVDGRSKAMFFARFGFSEDDPEPLRVALEQHPTTNPMTKRVTTGFGEKYVVSCSIQTPDGRNPCINTVWIDEGSSKPKLVTAYPD